MIGYYVHHQGSGHLHRMLSFSAQVREPLTVLSSLPRPTDCTLPWSPSYAHWSVPAQIPNRWKTSPARLTSVSVSWLARAADADDSSVW